MHWALLLPGLILIVPVLYWVDVIMRYPDVHCRHCEGGRDYDTDHTHYRPLCRFCASTGKRPRVELRILFCLF